MPEEVFVAYSDTREYNFMYYPATEGFIEAGSQRHSLTFEWATFNTMRQAVECERKLIELVKHFQGRYDNEVAGQEDRDYFHRVAE